ncbi:DUF1810 domain-containing protein [Oryzifoliimicrobium ureilyticus]|uniref:DUF1810 domain-containing protein n=1 Tax=Oryzifoliimicrobium ureilyticus TaxID=3113724 RepID=UPI003076387A
MAGTEFDLQRFKTAQEPVFETALSELRQGQKRSHWIWFIFPQLRGLGRSPTAQFYGLSSLAEASAYLEDPLLKERLDVATSAVLGHKNMSALDILGSPDDLKFRSSMTLFNEASGHANPLFQEALEQFFDGMPDERTRELLKRL